MGKTLTQGELAEKIGTNQKAYSAYETGRNMVPGDLQGKIRKLGYQGPWPHEARKLPPMPNGGIVTREEFLKWTGRIEALESAIRALSPGLDAVKNLDERVQELERRKP